MGSVDDVRFASLYDDYYQHIYACCRRRTTPDRVDDAVAETFLTAWRRIDDVPDDREGLLWLYRVAYRVHGGVGDWTSREEAEENGLLRAQRADEWVTFGTGVVEQASPPQTERLALC